MGELKQDFQGYDFKILDEAKQAIEGVAENIQEATLVQYTSVVKRLSIKGQLPIEAAQTKGSYYAYRAAWIGYYAHQIRVQVGRLTIWGKQWSEMDPEHQQITFVIISAKRRSHAIETRQFTIQNPQSLAFRYLLSQSVLHGKTLTLRQVNYQAVSKEVERLGCLAFEFSKVGISPYCFRHAFSGDLHATELSREEIARCLGHKTDETQRHYSRSVKHSSGGFKITDIHSTEPVKALVDAKIQKLIESQSALPRLL